MNVLLDLDGTLTDPRPGILRSLRHALERLGAPCPPDAALERYIGPPLQQGFAELLGPARQADVGRAIALYREVYAAGALLENRVYDGVPEALEALARAGHDLRVCTSKPTVFAERIVRHFGLDAHLEAVHGAELDGTRADKRELVRWILDRAALAPAATVMVGDRRHDAEAARANGVRAVGVTWGYGSAEELLGAGAERLVAAPAELPAAIAALGA